MQSRMAKNNEKNKVVALLELLVVLVLAVVVLWLIIIIIIRHAPCQCVPPLATNSLSSTMAVSL